MIRNWIRRNIYSTWTDRLGTYRRFGPEWLMFGVLNRFEAYNLYFLRRLIALKPIDYARYGKLEQ